MKGFVSTLFFAFVVIARSQEIVDAEADVSVELFAKKPVATVKVVTSQDGTKIYSEAIGNPKNPHVVFVHGLGCAGTAFDRLFALPSMLDNIYMVRYDARGHARSGKPASPPFYESARYAQDFAAVAKAFSLKTPFYAGWSLGGAISADLTAAKIPIAGLIYLSALPYMGDILPIVATPLVLSYLPGLMTPVDGDDALNTRIEFASTLVAPGFQTPYVDMLSFIGAATSMPGYAASLLLTRTQNSEPLKAAGRAGLPLAIIHGDKDLQVSSSAVISQMKPIFKNIDITIIPGAGHIPFYEKPEAVAKPLIKYVQKVTRQRAFGRR